MKYKVGDKVLIKTWDAMEKEFGVIHTGSILCEFTFTKNMEEVLPKDRILEISEIEDYDNRYYNKDFTHPQIGPFSISEDMIQGLAQPEKIKPRKLKQY